MNPKNIENNDKQVLKKKKVKGTHTHTHPTKGITNKNILYDKTSKK